MSISQRQNRIMQILGERGFVTVQELARITYTSPSSIRRDLTYMQNNGLVKRSHGGVTLPDRVLGVASFYDRRSKNVSEKRLIAKKAAALLKDNQSILLDGSSTACFLLPHIAKLTSAVLFTNNISTALAALELGIDTHCIGGRAVNGSAVLSGIEAYKTVSTLHTDILFFSSQSLDRDGTISDSTDEENYLRALMIGAAKETVFLCSSDKFNQRSLHTLTTLDQIGLAVFDREYPELQCPCKTL